MEDYRRHGWVATSCRCSIVVVVLLVFISQVADALHSQHPPAQHSASLSRNCRVSQEILEGLHQSSTASNINSSSEASARLDLERDFYDKSTGLHSEGVWHNCMAGIAALQLSAARSTHPKSSSHPHRQYYDDAIRIADSLFRYSWDGISFRRRSWSGNWDHSRLLMSEDTTDIVQANYYMESSEHRCIQHAIALVFWSMLASQRTDGKGNNNICSQQALILKQFVDEFWNGERWTTISRTQGSGTTLRPSASSAATTDNTSSSSSARPYFRAVDQAVAVLACLQHLQLLDNTNNNNLDKNERDRIVRLIETTCNDLLDEHGFGYNNLSTARTYLGIDRNRNFWHEGWVMLALTSARNYNINSMDTTRGGHHLKMLWNNLREKYTTTTTDDTTIWHWPLSKKMKSNVRYCGDNALAYAIRRNMRCNSLASENDEDDDDAVFWDFIEMLRSSNNKDNDSNDPSYHLVSVADAYPQVRLHPNSELAALLVWPPQEVID